MRVISANVNGIRAAERRGGLIWLAEQNPDVLALQEIRASDEQLRDVLSRSAFRDWHLAHSPSTAAKGHAGVAVISRAEPTRICQQIIKAEDGAASEFDAQGRWIGVTVPGPSGGEVTIASTYVHTGGAGTQRQEEKYRFLDALGERLTVWTAQDHPAVITGDLNVAHTEADLKNWKGNLGKSGFLPQERARLDRWLGGGVVDVHRRLHGPGPGPYTWWSWRGKAFDNDAGWRIDYHLATPALAAKAMQAQVGRAQTYALRWSDHAPVIVDYDV